MLKKLRPGDIYTHCYYAPVPMLDDQGRLLPYLFEARKRGILFDVGHGGAAFEFRQAVPAVKQGFPPDTISTDVHSGSLNSGMKDQLNVMSKFLNMGMSLYDVVAASTWKPAQIIRCDQIGHLSAGALADVAVLRLEKGQFAFVDSYGARMDGTERLANELTIASGRVVCDLNGRTHERWDRLGKYGPIGDPSWDGMTIVWTLKSRYPMPFQSEAEWLEKAVAGASNERHFAVERRTDREHIGNASIHDIDWISRTAAFGLFVGDPGSWNRGFGSDAIRTLVRFAFDEMN